MVYVTKFKFKFKKNRKRLMKETRVSSRCIVRSSILVCLDHTIHKMLFELLTLLNGFRNFLHTLASTVNLVKTADDGFTFQFSRYYIDGRWFTSQN